jgi:hypothetical protein
VTIYGAIDDLSDAVGRMFGHKSRCLCLVNSWTTLGFTIRGHFENIIVRLKITVFSREKDLMRRIL